MEWPDNQNLVLHTKCPPITTPKGQVISIMFKKYNKRGSVLLMVVGLLVILGTLGGTFLLISSLDAKQAKLLAGRGRAELIASGGVSQVVRILGEDLHFDPMEASAPYTAENSAGALAHAYFRDFRTSTEDRHIYAPGNPSNILGADPSYHKVSTDIEGGTADAYLIPTREFDDEGREYRIAIKVEDTGGKLCLNTGGHDYVTGVNETTKLVRSPAMIDLKGYLGGDYSGVHNQRSGSSTTNISLYDIECGRRLLSPVEGKKYLPFAIADEIFLRWRGTGRKASFGRVFEQLGNITDAQKQMLTTLNCSRSITRNPPSKVIGARIDLSEVDALDSDRKDELYSQLVLIAGSDDGKGGGLAQGPTLSLKNAWPGGYFDFGWTDTSMISSFSSKNKRCSDPNGKSSWVFTDLPPATYRVWVTWSHSSSDPPKVAAATVPYLVYTGGSIVNFAYAPGNLQRTFVANQKSLPPTVINGTRWQSLGSYSASGMLAIEIHGPQGVPAGESQFSFADAVMIESVALDLGSGSKPAAHLTANTWAAMAEDTDENNNRCYPFRPKGENYTVFGLREQPYITEAFATHTTNTRIKVENPPSETILPNTWRWGAAIELMNYSDKAIDLSKYKIALGTTLTKDTPLLSFPAGSTIPKATATSGGRLVIYDFDLRDVTLTAADVFGAAFKADSWKRVVGMNFDNSTIRLVKMVPSKEDPGKTYRVPIDHISSARDSVDTLQYSMTTQALVLEDPPPGQAGKGTNKTTSANIRRDDSIARKRYAVAKYWKPAAPTEVVTSAIGTKLPCAITANDHKLGSDNAIGTTKLPETKVKQGFRMKLPYGLLSGPGAMSEFYLAGPIIQHDGESDDPSATLPPSDFPEMLANEYAISESRGRANSRVINKKPFDDVQLWNKYPRTRNGASFAWPMLISEIIETVPTDRQRGDSPGRVYGRLNVNTASKEALEELPWPPGVTAGTAAQQIVGRRDGNNGFVTPGEIALAFTDSATNPELDRDAIYSAISSCVSVSSDVYSVNIKVQLVSNGAPAASDPAWYYMAIIDRGGAVFSTDKPAVLLFTQVK